MEGWRDVLKDFSPHSAPTVPARIQRVADTYRNPHSWSGKKTREIALGPDTFEKDPTTGKPVVHEYDYRVVYRWTSHYVHPAIGALENHIVVPGRERFVVRSGYGEDYRDMASFNIACYVGKTMVSFYRCMRDPQPPRLANWTNALVKHFGPHDK